MKRNHKEKRITVEGRIFQIEFWEEILGSAVLNYVSVSEIILTEVKPFWFSRKTVIREVKDEIQKAWGPYNRVEWAMNAIENYIRSEKERAKDYQDIEDFCNREN